MQARDDDDPIHVRALACLLGVIVCKDLLAFDITLYFVAHPDRFHLSFIAAIPRLPPTEASYWFLDGVVLISFLAALRMTSGSRGSALWLALIYGGALLSNALGYANNLYLLVLLLGVCSLAPLRAASVAWPRRVGQLTVSAVYLGAGLSKLEPVFLSGRTLEAILYHDSHYAQLIGWYTPVGFRVMSWFIAMSELGLAFAIWHPRTARYALAFGAAFHAAIAPFVSVRIFSHIMLASYVLFLPALQFQRAEAWLARNIQPILRAHVCVIAAVALNLLDPFAKIRNAGLVQIACALVIHELWRRNAATRAVQRSLIRPSQRLGPAAIACYVAFQAFTIVKPWFGFSKFCAWRMFSEAFTLTVETEVLQEGSWKKTLLANSSSRWSPTLRTYYWSSLSEERFYLQGYQRWLAREHHLPVQLRLVVEHSQIKAPPQKLIIGPE